MATAYNFHCENPTLAAEIASLRTADIQEIFKACFSVTVNIMQKFAKPPKCKAAEYIVGNAPEQLLTQHLAQKLAHYKAAANNGAGRPVNKYRHDPNHDNDAWRNNSTAQRQAARSAGNQAASVQIENVPATITGVDMASENNDVAEIVREANTETVRYDAPENADPDAADNLAKALAEILASGNMLDENKVREIARQEDAKVSEFIQRTISEAVARVTMPTRVVIDYAERDGTTATRDMGIQHKNFPILLNLCAARDHNGYAFPIWLPGPAGSGKTTAAMNVAVSLGLEFHHNGAVNDEFQLLGFRDAGGTFHETPFYKAYKDGGVYLFDEVDASAANALVALNAALENGHCTFGNGETIKRHTDCIIIAAANTFGMGATHEYVGRNKIDAATVDRFIMLAWEYDNALEDAIAQNPEWVAKVRKVRAAVARHGIKHVVSPRASIRGAALLRTGNFTEDQVMALTVYKGMTADQIASVARG